MKASLYQAMVSNRTYFIALAVIMAALISVGVYKKELAFFPLIFSMCALLFFTMTFAQDSESKVNRTILSGPVTPNMIVDVNYLVVIIIGGIGFLISGIAAFFISSLDWPTIVLYASFTLAITLVFTIIQLPLFYQFGPNKARLFLVAIFAIIFASSSFIGNNKQTIAEWVHKVLEWPPLASAGILLAVTVVLTAASCGISRKIITHQEF